MDPQDPVSAIELEDGWPEPEPLPGQVRIRVAATTVNMHDLWTLRGVGAHPGSFPRILGCDIVGWDPEGREVMVTGAFGDPDQGGGDETLDPRRALCAGPCVDRQFHARVPRLPPSSPGFVGHAGSGKSMSP
jgi:hypothetical protein